MPRRNLSRGSDTVVARGQWGRYNIAGEESSSSEDYNSASSTSSSDRRIRRSPQYYRTRIPPSPPGDSDDSNNTRRTRSSTRSNQSNSPRVSEVSFSSGESDSNSSNSSLRSVISGLSNRSEVEIPLSDTDSIQSGSIRSIRSGGSGALGIWSDDDNRVNTRSRSSSSSSSNSDSPRSVSSQVLFTDNSDNDSSISRTSSPPIPTHHFDEPPASPDPEPEPRPRIRPRSMFRLFPTQVPSSGVMANATATAAAAATSSRPSTATVSNGSSVSFECSVCLESLDSPASIEDVALPNRPHGMRSRGSSSNGAPITPLDVAATQCGHMYHLICLEKWFQEQGKRTCPSCRKSVPKSKLIRLFPNNASEAERNCELANGPPPVPAAVAVPLLDAEGNCARGECQEMRVIHNTLMTDYAELQDRFGELAEREEVKEAQLRSLLEDNARKAEEIDRLKRSMEESPGSSGANGSTKRRRH